MGAGPAGLAAVIYALRGGVRAVVLNKGLWGGQVAITSQVENYPAVEKLPGYAFADKLYKLALAQGADVRQEEALQVALQGRVKRVKTAKEEYQAQAVILASGAKRRLLGCPGEERLTGKGVSYCATCDGAFFRQKAVAVVGGGNTALEEALFLSNLCSRVVMAVRGEAFRGERPLIDAVLERENIQPLFGHTVTEILGDKKVTGLLVQDKSSKNEKELPVQGVFIAIGLQPETRLFQDQLQTDANGYLLAGEDCETSLPGVYAAGDNRQKPLRQIITAAADGAVAASRAVDYINRLKHKAPNGDRMD